LTWLLFLGTVIFLSGAGGWYNDCRCFATSMRIVSFFAFAPKAFSAFAVFVVGRKTSLYAAISMAGGAGLCSFWSQVCPYA
jgi:hypothetical protein